MTFLICASCIAQDSPFVVVLGTIQDAGSPQIGCEKKCCEGLFVNPRNDRKVASLGLIDPTNAQIWLIDATPDYPSQLRALRNHAPFEAYEKYTGIFLTHAHIGHYTGLMYLGKEALNANKVYVHAMPRMKSFLETNGPWNQLVSKENIVLADLSDATDLQLSPKLRVTPFLVPHRDEFSETVGFKIKGPLKTLLYIPDIDKWSKWSKSIVAEVQAADYAIIDGTFYDGDEIKGRDISEIPHPFIIESMELFKGLSKEDKAKIYFIHFNHTNPLINLESDQAKEVLKAGFNIAQINQVIKL
ncbi:MAG: pyrroloquinoline quinone biosynthesis protein PqqB [Bacteroidetes bacterium]|nr:MAG: pyrroloquinoline quinone biosynthesis protein PqqB [Bacteroidota bacterium]